MNWRLWIIRKLIGDQIVIANLPIDWKLDVSPGTHLLSQPILIFGSDRPLRPAGAA